MVTLWLHIVQNTRFTYTSIDQKFMVPGHSYLPNDRDFGSIESHKRRLQQVYTPSDWADVIRNSRRVNPFEVTQMSQQDFLDLKALSRCIVNRKVDERGAKVQWLKMRWIRVEKSKPLKFQYRFSHNELEVWKTVDLRRRRGRPCDICKFQLTRLYGGPRQVSSPKLSDIRDLMDYIPPVYQKFYEELNSKESDQDTSSIDDDSESGEESGECDDD